MKPTVSVVVPVYFEEAVIEEFHRRMMPVLQGLQDMEHEIVYVNDGSTDRSLELLLGFHRSDPEHVTVVNLSRNFGHQLAVTAGLDAANGDAVVVIDADLQDPPEVIPKMLEKWRKGYAVVYGVRAKRSGESMFKLATAKVFYRLLGRISEVDIPHDSGDFRLLDRKVVDELSRLRENNRYIRGLVAWLGFKQYGLEYQRDARFAGSTKYNLRKMLRFAFDGITSFSEKPLNVSVYLGLASSSLALAWALWIFCATLLGMETVAGWSSLMVSLLFFGGVQLLSIGIIGQYIGRIHKEIKNRPLYVIDSLHGGSKELRP